MITVGSILLRVVAAAEIIVFCGYLFWGAHGVRAIRAMQATNSMLEQQIAHKEQLLQTTRAEIEDWKQYPYYKEQYAREQLQMARKDDEVYLW